MALASQKNIDIGVRCLLCFADGCWLDSAHGGGRCTWGGTTLRRVQRRMSGSSGALTSSVSKTNTTVNMTTSACTDCAAHPADVKCCVTGVLTKHLRYHCFLLSSVLIKVS